MTDLLHYEDFTVGAVTALGPYAVSAEEIVAFASEFDPQPFHLSEDGARRSILGKLCASGWHSCAMLMRMICDAYLNRSASLGSSGMSDVKWMKPVYAGETLRGRMTVLAKRVSAKRPELGIIESRWEIYNDAGEMKLEQTGIVFIRVRAP